MKRRTLLKLSAATLVINALPSGAQELSQTEPLSTTDLLPKTELAREIREAYIYTYPMVKNYLTLYQYAVETDGKQYKGPFNEVSSVARVYTPSDTAIITPNSDTPYSFIVFDLRAEPVVVTLPPIEQERYYSVQLVDLYTNNVDYLGTRVDGNDGGDFLITGPGWTGEIPSGIKRVIEMPTWLGIGLVRTQLFSPDDLGKVKDIQALYKSRLLSTWAGTEKPAAAPVIDWPPISDEMMVSDHWQLAAFLLPFAPPWPGDESQREGLAQLGITPDAQWSPQNLPATTLGAMQSGASATYQEIRDAAAALTDSANIFGTPEAMKGQYLTRAAAAQGGIYGNTAAEALYVIQVVDGGRQPLDGSKSNYTLTFSPETMPPVDAFWSLTMYDRQSQLLIDNPIDRYLINSAMLNHLVRDDAGNITLYIQKDSPGTALEPNWLPAPGSSFYTVMRLYIPQAQALDGRWTPPMVNVTG